MLNWRKCSPGFTNKFFGRNETFVIIAISFFCFREIYFSVQPDTSAGCGRNSCAVACCDVAREIYQKFYHHSLAIRNTHPRNPQLRNTHPIIQYKQRFVHNISSYYHAPHWHWVILMD